MKKFEFRFTDKAKSTRTGFSHTSTIKAYQIDFNPEGTSNSCLLDRASHSCSYLNRTWEPYPFQTSRMGAAAKLLKAWERDKNITAEQLAALKEFIKTI